MQKYAASTSLNEQGLTTRPPGSFTKTESSYAFLQRIRPMPASEAPRIAINAGSGTLVAAAANVIAENDVMLLPWAVRLKVPAVRSKPL